MRQRKPKTYYATRGRLTASGASKSEAKAALESMVDWACTVSFPVVESRFGLLIIVAPSPNGYCTAVLNPAEIAHGSRRDSWCQHPQGNYADALQSARIHAAQNAWHAGVENDQDFVTLAQVGNKAADLLRWIEFQRGYIAAKAQGMNDAEAFNAANGLGHLNERKAA